MIESTETAAPKSRLADMTLGTTVLVGFLILPTMFGTWCIYRAIASAPQLYIPYVYGPLVVSFALSSIRPFGLLLAKPVVALTIFHGLALVLGRDLLALF